MSEPELTDARDKIVKILEPLSRAEKADVLRKFKSQIDGMPAPKTDADVRSEMAALKQEVDSILSEKGKNVAALEALLAECSLSEVVRDMERRARLAPFPPPVSASNVETLMMSFGYVMPPAAVANTPIEEPGTLWTVAQALHESVRKASQKLRVFTEGNDERFVMFANRWAASGFARLEIGHKLAAALCLTDVPGDVETRAPWEAWSIVIPNGLFPEQPAWPPTRVWCLGTEASFYVWPDGKVQPIKGLSAEGRGAVEQLNKLGESLPEPESSALRYSDAIANLIRGACLALSNPGDFRKERQHAPSARAANKPNRHGPPDLKQARFLLSAPVKVDLREHLTSVLTGRKGTSPAVQFLVRGHWRNQAHGPRNSLRKTIWVEPFWKGPEESRVLLRQHKITEAP